MDRIKTLLKRLLLTIAALLAIVVLLGVLSRLTTPTAAQRETVALMERDELPEGPDAFGLLYTLGHDVPFDEIDTVVAADAATVAAWPETWPESWDTDKWLTEHFEWRRDDYPSLFPSEADRALFCRLREENGCLARVRAAPEATAEALARNERLVARAERVRGFDVVRNAMSHLYAPMPDTYGATLPMTAHALAFARGEEAFAVRETCRDLAAWRRLAMGTDSLIVSMSGAELAGEGYAGLLADMLSEWPVDRPLPDDCTTALAPPTDEELLFCNALRGEFRTNRRWLADNSVHLRRHGDWGDRLEWSLFFNVPATAAGIAEAWAPYCRADQPGRQELERPDSSWIALLRWPCLGNLGGCVSIALSTLNGWGDYADRLRDFGARLRLLGALAWIREQAADTGATADELVDRLPPELADPAQPVTVAPDGRSLRVALTWDRRGEWAAFSLPPALWRASPND